MDTPNRNVNDRDVLTVSRLNREARALIEGAFPFVWVQGELSNLARPASGHLYFSLKDANCQVRCALFRQHQRHHSPALKDGSQVIVRARASVYEGRGEFQLIVEHIEDAGEGALKRAFELLKARLATEGLFELARKRPLPRLPRCIGVITSPSGAVIHDILTTLRRRFPAIGVRLYPVPVQGEGAAAKIAEAIRRAGEDKYCDALIVARGGGSLEDLWAFNDETVVRAIAASALPVVVGVGHETDVTIADFVADARAPTPTAAAEMLSPHWEEWIGHYDRAELRLTRAVRVRLQQYSQRVDTLTARLVHPRHRLEGVGQRLQGLSDRLQRATLARLQDAAYRTASIISTMNLRNPRPMVFQLRHRLQTLSLRLTTAVRGAHRGAQTRVERIAATLNALSPLATLSRGYAIVSSANGSVVRHSADVTKGDLVRARLAEGELECRVESARLG